MDFFDTHAHLDDAQLQEDLPGVLQRARQAGVTTILTVGTTRVSSEACLRISRQYPEVLAAVGIQPNYVQESTPDDWERIVQMACDPRVRAIGETGLDAYWDYTPFEQQQQLFAAHLRLAQETGRPVIVHMRDCGAAAVAMLQEARARGPLRGVMHSFTGTAQIAEQCLAAGLHISFAGMLTFKKSEQLREVARHIPVDRLLLETDAPYLAPHPVRGRRPNEPALLVHTAQCLTEIRGMTLEELAAATTTNATRVFG